MSVWDNEYYEDECDGYGSEPEDDGERPDMRVSVEQLESDGWTVLTGGSPSKGYWAQARRARDGRIHHREGGSLAIAIRKIELACRERPDKPETQDSGGVANENKD